MHHKGERGGVADLGLVSDATTNASYREWQERFRGGAASDTLETARRVRYSEGVPSADRSYGDTSGKDG